MNIQTLYKHARKALLALMICFTAAPAMAQEDFGNTLNLGLGLGYYRYTSRATPVLHANYEFNVAKDFTLAPFVTFYSYGNDYYWANPNNPPRYYRYRHTVIPIGVKGTYYFDDLLDAGSDWDFYLAGSLGFTIVRTRWESGYLGDRNVARGASPLYLDLHVGAEYHVNDNIGLFLDLSSGVSTFGVGIH